MKKNVILITIDCLRTDHLNCYGYNRETTPFINSIAKRGTLFRNAFANGPFTSAAFPAILTSTYPLKNGRYITLNNRIFVSESLQEKGIKTAAIHSNPYLSDYMGYNRGFDYFEDFINYSESMEREVKRVRGWRHFVFVILDKYPFLKKILTFFKKIIFSGISARASKKDKAVTSPYVPAETITKYAINWLEKNYSSPFFLWIHYMDLHEPYLIGDINIRQKYSRRLSKSSILQIKKDNIQDIINLYDDKLSYIDANLKLLFHFLKDTKILDNVSIILTSDHGQQFYEHNIFGHRVNYFEETIHIPLIVYGGHSKEKQLDKIVCQLEIAPTILSLYDITPPPSYEGFNLFSDFKRHFIISETSYDERGSYIENHKMYPPKFVSFCYRTEEWKYIFYSDKPEELYNLKEDPAEKNNITSKCPEIIDEVKKALKEHMEETFRAELSSKPKH